MKGVNGCGSTLVLDSLSRWGEAEAANGLSPSFAAYVKRWAAQGSHAGLPAESEPQGCASGL